MKWVSHVLHCVLAERVKQRLRGDILSRPGLLLRSLVPKTRDKAAPSVSVGDSGHGGGGGGGEAAGWVADSFLLFSTLLEGRAPRLFQSPPPLSQKEKDTWEIRSISSSSFNNARCLSSDRSEIEAGWAMEDPREIGAVALT